MSGNQGWNSGGEPNSDPSEPQPTPRNSTPQEGAPPPMAYGTPYITEAPPFQPQPSYSGPSRLSLIPLIIILAVATAIGAGFFFFRDRVANDVTSLAQGECFDVPTDEDEISQVQRQPCNEPHDGEVIAVLTHPAPPGEAYPVISGFDDYIQENCVPAFQAYVGPQSGTAVEYDIGYLLPTLSGWNDGDRRFTCYVSRSDGLNLTNTVRAPGYSPLASQAAPAQ
jgi:hypothetical protein